MVVATSRDVARMAGVSQSTVSRALRGEGGMSEQTRDRIQQAAMALNYVTLETGRSLSTRATHRIGMVAGELTNPFYPELVEPMRADLHRRGFRTLLIPDRDETPVSIDQLADGSLDGVVILTALLGSPLPQALADRGIPVVLVNRELDGAATDVCVMDNRDGARQAAALIADLGHTEAAAILGPVQTSTSRDREAGLREGLGERGIAIRASMVCRGSFSYETGFAAMTALLNRADRPTAVFCANDVIAVGACNAAMTAGVQPGRDLTVVGFDDIPMACWPAFQLTTIRGDLTALAEEAIRLLTQRIADPVRARERVVLPTHLVLRGTHGSSANPRSRRRTPGGS
jgi:LacI family transcriptional regulator